MRTHLTLRLAVYGLLLFFTTQLTAQVTRKASIGDLVYEDYKKNGIENALQKYQDVLKKESQKYHIDEFELNRIGYVLMNEDRDMAAAEKVFKLNLQEYPEAANPRDSYADYLTVAGKPDEAKKYFQESINLTKKGKGSSDDTSLYLTSLGKLSHLEKKHRQLDFLLGQWELEMQEFSDGQMINSRRMLNNFNYDEENGIFIGDYLTQDGKSVAKRIFAYDAADDEFDLVYIGANENLGVWPSTLTVQDKGHNSFEFMEEYEDEQQKLVKMKHLLKFIGPDKVDWEVLRDNGNNNWEKVSAMKITRKQ